MPSTEDIMNITVEPLVLTVSRELVGNYHIRRLQTDVAQDTLGIGESPPLLQKVSYYELSLTFEDEFSTKAFTAHLPMSTTEVHVYKYMEALAANAKQWFEDNIK